MLVICLLGLSPANARPVSEAEKSAILDSVNAMITALVQNDMIELVRVAPDRILEAMAKQANVSVKELLAEVQAYLEEDMSQVEIYNFYFGIEGLDLTDTVHPDGTEITYGIIPAGFEMEFDGVRYRQDTEYLVLSEGDSWYIIRFAEVQQLLMIQDAYPFLTPLNGKRCPVGT